MTTTPVSKLELAQGVFGLFSKTGKLWAAVIAVLMVGLHWHFLSYSVRLGMGNADWSHVLIIPVISLYYIYLHRQRLMATPRRVEPFGAALIYFGVAGYIIGSLLLRNPMAMGYSMICTIFGIVLLALGPAMMRILWFPILFLGFGVRVSELIWAHIATRMQTFAAEGAVILLQAFSSLTGLDASLRGSTIDLDYGQAGGPTAMNVAEACAGMRMLMAFLALGVALAFLFPRAWWQRLAMVLLAAPIAIFVNALRVAVLGWLHLIDPELARGDSHLFVGMLMLIPAAGLLMLVGWCLDKILIVEDKRERIPPPVPFESDPNQIDIPPKPVAVGVGIGLAVLLAFVAIESLMLRYALPAAGVSTVFIGAMNKSAMLIQLAMHAGLAVGVWLVARAVLKKRRLLPALGAGCGMLLAGLIVQAAAIQVFGIALSKEALPLRHGFALDFAGQAGDWQRIHQDPPEPKDIEDELGTKEYFNSYYINNAAGYNSSNVTPKTEKVLKGEKLVDLKGIEGPGNVAKVHIAYYTGMLDTVPHVPDKCWIVAGQQLVYRELHTLTLTRADYQPDPEHPGHVLADSTGYETPTRVRIPGKSIGTDPGTGQTTVQVPAIVFTGQSAEGQRSTALYFFLANGQAIASSNDVRFSFNLTDQYSYYCKVEVMFPGVNDPDEVQAYAEDVLSDLLPEIMAALPDWTEVQAGQYPAPASAGSKN